MNKKLFLLILIPALVLIGAYAFVRYSVKAAVSRDEEIFSTSLKKADSSAAKQTSTLDLRPLFMERLHQIVARASDNIYDFTIDSMDIDVLLSTAVFYDVVLKPNKEKASLLQKTGEGPEEIYSLTLKKVEVHGINADDALTQKTMDYELVRIINPVFEIYRNGKSKALKEDFTQGFLKEMKKLSVKNLVVEGGKVIIHNKGKQKVLNDLSVNMKNIVVDSATRLDKKRFLFARNANLSFRNYKTIPDKNEYRLAIDKVNIEATEQKLTLTGLSYQSTLDKKQFARRQKFAKEYFRFSVPSVTLTGVDWWRIINEEEITAEELTVNNGKLFVYLDRSLTPKSRVGSFPVQLLSKLPLKLSIDHLRASNLDLAYEEYNPISKQSGTIYMDNIRMHVTNISNLPGGKKPVAVNASTLFMHKVPINADFVFQRNNSGTFTAHINSDKDFDGSLINSFAPSLGLVEFKDGTLQKIDAVIKGDESKANGKVTVLYKDLKLHLLEKDRNEKELDKKGFTTFFANSFLLKKDNPGKGEKARNALVDFERIAEGGFFMLVWKTTIAGALKTIGAPTKIAYKTVNQPVR
jgi:hypothetical protein